MVALSAACSVQPVERSSWQSPVAPAHDVAAQLMLNDRHALLHEYAV